MKAIITKYHSPTATRGSRISARAEGVPRVSIPYPHELSGEAVHLAAAQKLADEYAWCDDGHHVPVGRPHRWRLEGGGLPDGTGYAFVFVPVRAEG